MYECIKRKKGMMHLTYVPDRLEYFGHYSVIGFIDNRYFVESDMLGLHVLDMEGDQLVYYEEIIKYIF